MLAYSKSSCLSRKCGENVYNMCQSTRCFRFQERINLRVLFVVRLSVRQLSGMMLLHTVAITAYIAVVVVAGDPTPPGHWEVRWQDDFDGSSLDKSKWTTWSSSYSDNCRGNKKDHKLEYNLPENVQVENGILKIIARRQQHHA